MPQLEFHTYVPQLFWLAVFFITLFLVLSRGALPKIAEVLETRAERIGSDLDRAAKLKAEANDLLAQYEKAQAEARDKALSMAREHTARHAAEAAERQAKLAAELGERTKTAERRIQESKGQALANIREVAASVVQAMAQRLIEVEVGRPAAEAAVDAVLKERG
jgi:F-type H+-transporting ATPase subunit b